MARKRLTILQELARDYPLPKHCRYYVGVYSKAGEPTWGYPDDVTPCGRSLGKALSIVRLRLGAVSLERMHQWPKVNRVGQANSLQAYHHPDYTDGIAAWKLGGSIAVVFIGF